jgi:hypothetical protein
MSQPPSYDNVQERFLDPDLVFDSQTYRHLFHQRDRAFANAIVDMIDR